MDYEEVGNFSNFTFEEDMTPRRSGIVVAHQIIFVLYCIVGICADAAIIYTILNFKRLRSVPNILLANWSIADLCSLLVTPSGYRLITVLDNISMSPAFICGLLHFGAVFHVTTVLFVIIASIDWFIAAYYPKILETIRSYHRYVISTLWIASALWCCVSTGLCIADRDNYAALYLLIASFWTMLSITIVLQSSRIVRKYCLNRPVDYPSLMLTLTSAFIVCWFLGFFIHMATYFLYFRLLAQYLTFSSSIVNFTILYFWDKDFQACFVLALKRPGSRYQDVVFDNENFVCRDKSTVKISFDKEKEVLIIN